MKSPDLHLSLSLHLLQQQYQCPLDEITRSPSFSLSSSSTAAVSHNVGLLCEIPFTIGLVKSSTSTLASVVVEVPHRLVHLGCPRVHSHDAQRSITVLVR